MCVRLMERMRRAAATSLPAADERLMSWPWLAVAIGIVRGARAAHAEVDARPKAPVELLRAASPVQA